MFQFCTIIERTVIMLIPRTNDHELNWNGMTWFWLGDFFAVERKNSKLETSHRLSFEFANPQKILEESKLISIYCRKNHCCAKGKTRMKQEKKQLDCESFSVSVRLNRPAQEQSTWNNLKPNRTEQNMEPNNEQEQAGSWTKLQNNRKESEPNIRFNRLGTKTSNPLIWTGQKFTDKFKITAWKINSSSKWTKQQNLDKWNEKKIQE